MIQKQLTFIKNLNQISIYQFSQAKKSFTSEQFQKANEEFNKKKQKLAKQQKIKFDYLYGINPVMTALNSQSREQFYELYVHENQQQNTNSRVSNIINKCQELNLNVKFLNSKKLDNFCSKIKHYNNSKTQNVILKCLPKQYQKISHPSQIKEKIQESSNQQQNTYFPLWVCLQGVTDPQNLGAILRSCYFLGVQAVIVENKHKSPLSTAVSKSSAGAMELMDIYSVDNMQTFINDLQSDQDNGFNFQVLVTGIVEEEIEDEIIKNQIDNQQTIKNKQKVLELSQIDFDYQINNGVALVFGAEGEGVSKNIMNQADQIVHLSQNRYLQQKQLEFPYNLVESMNVSAAAAIFIQNIQNKIISHFDDDKK